MSIIIDHMSDFLSNAQTYIIINIDKNLSLIGWGLVYIDYATIQSKVTRLTSIILLCQQNF